MKTPLLMILLLTVLVTIPFRAFSETLTYTCHYHTYADDKGIHKLEDDLKLVFLVNSSTGTATIVGSDRKSDVTVDILYSPSEGMAFVEKKNGADVLTTSIDKRGKSVHSKNIIVDGQLSPAQYYGRCTNK